MAGEEETAPPVLYSQIWSPGWSLLFFFDVAGGDGAPPMSPSGSSRVRYPPTVPPGLSSEIAAVSRVMSVGVVPAPKIPRGFRDKSDYPLI